MLRFKGKDFLTLMDFSKEEIDFVLKVSEELKSKYLRGEKHNYLEGKTIAMIFEKPSTRTRFSFQAAIAHLGAQSFYAMRSQMQLARGEPIKDTARVLDRYCDGLVIRTFGQEVVEEYAAYMSHPVVNALTDLTHPCQGLADLLTIKEKKGDFSKLKLAYTGDIWNVAQTLMVAAAIYGMKAYFARPKGYNPDKRIWKFVQEKMEETEAEVVLTSDLSEAVQGADVVYANTWHSMGGPEKEKEKRIKDFKPYQINNEVLKEAKKDAIFMHCLPGYRGEEMTDEVIEGPHSVVFDQAENRMHTEKAVLSLFIP